MNVQALDKRPLQLLFGFIFVSLLCYTIWASSQQAVTEWQGLIRRPDNWWTIATLIDAYYGFITFYVWVVWKERRSLPRVAWFLAMAMALFVLLQLRKLAPGDSMATLLALRNA
jgi:hypothetical protein